MFSGSYDPSDVIFLLKPVKIESTPLDAKESLIQSGTKHYSEMITWEQRPTDSARQDFIDVVNRQKQRFVRDIVALANRIACYEGDICLVSLARAGTPIGALLRRILVQMLSRRVSHYSISLIRDRGIDHEALKYILQQHAPESLVFVDGWCAKGLMESELRVALEQFHRQTGVFLRPGLHVVSDLSGLARVAATTDDYLIPNCLLGATIGGLVSRSILSADLVGSGDFHGCIYYQEFADVDMSTRFLDLQMSYIHEAWEKLRNETRVATDAEKESRRRSLDQLLKRVSLQFGEKEGRLKPGIGEATRAFLRRVPRAMVIRDQEAEDVKHLLDLAKNRRVAVYFDSTISVEALVLL